MVRVKVKWLIVVGLRVLVMAIVCALRWLLSSDVVKDI